MLYDTVKVGRINNTYKYVINVINVGTMYKESEPLTSKIAGDVYDGVFFHGMSWMGSWTWLGRFSYLLLFIVEVFFLLVCRLGFFTYCCMVPSMFFIEFRIALDFFSFMSRDN